MLIKREYSPIASVLYLCIILMGIFFYNCENTITDIPVSINYGVVINEINYHSLDTSIPEDWVELYNPMNETIDIGLWVFKDDNNNVFTFSEDIFLQSGHYLVICKNIDSFAQLFPSISNVMGNFELGLDAAGERVRLFDSNGLLVDEVEYDDEDPWPVEADGNGPTLELIHPSLDNNKASNWEASTGNGTPGEINSVYDDE